MHRNCPKYLFTVVLFSTSLHGGRPAHYTVDVWSIPCVNITMEVSEDSAAGQTELELTAKTNWFFSYFFSVDNYYKTIFDRTTFQMLQYEKKVKQPNVEQEIEIKWNSEKGVYHFDKVEYKRPRDTHNVFSILMRGRSTEWEQLDTQWWNVDHEGELFRSRYLWIDSVYISVAGEEILTDHYRFDLIAAEEEPTQLVDITDVFTWGITLDGCIRQIWIERSGERRILRAEVTVKGFTLVAELK